MFRSQSEVSKCIQIPYDDAGEEEDKHDDDDSDHSAPQSEYENVCDRNIAEMQQKMNELGINNLFVKKTPAAKRNKKVKMSAPAPARKSARLAKKDDDV